MPSCRNITFQVGRDKTGSRVVGVNVIYLDHFRVQATLFCLETNSLIDIHGKRKPISKIYFPLIQNYIIVDEGHGLYCIDEVVIAAQCNKDVNMPNKFCSEAYFFRLSLYLVGS